MTAYACKGFGGFLYTKKRTTESGDGVNIFFQCCKRGIKILALCRSKFIFTRGIQVAFIFGDFDPEILEHICFSIIDY
jgi:hypothetical protein